MKNYKKIIAIALSLLMMLSLVACVEKATDERENTSDTIVSDIAEDTGSTEDTVASDETENEKLPQETIAEDAEDQLGSDSVVFKEKLGRTFGSVSTGENFGSEFDEENNYAWMEFEDEVHGNAVAARMMQLTDDTEATDIWVHVSLEWENAVDEIIFENATEQEQKGFSTVANSTLNACISIGIGYASWHLFSSIAVTIASMSASV